MSVYVLGKIKSTIDSKIDESKEILTCPENNS